MRRVKINKVLNYANYLIYMMLIWMFILIVLFLILKNALKLVFMIHGKVVLALYGMNMRHVISTIYNSIHYSFVWLKWSKLTVSMATIFKRLITKSILWHWLVYINHRNANNVSNEIIRKSTLHWNTYICNITHLHIAHSHI